MEELIITCKSCKARISFCSCCGKKLDWQDVDEEGAEPESQAKDNSCENCGAELAENANFCVECGLKVR